MKQTAKPRRYAVNITLMRPVLFQTDKLLSPEKQKLLLWLLTEAKNRKPDA